MEIKSADEPWSVVTLINGDKLKLRTICTGVRRKLDEKGDPLCSPNGLPEYEIDMQQIVSVQPKVNLDA